MDPFPDAGLPGVSAEPGRLAAVEACKLMA